MSLTLHAKLRPYLSLVGEEDRAGVAQAWEKQACHLAPRGIRVALVAALDGAPERCRHLLTCHGEQALPQIEQKDGMFYKQCYHLLRRYGCAFIDHPGTLISFERDPGEQRTWQDGCITFFTGRQAAEEALIAAFALHGILAQWNEEKNCDYTERLHARVSLSTSLERALQYLPHVWRGDTKTDGSVLNAAPEYYQTLLLAAGLRIEPSPMEDKPPLRLVCS